MLGPGRWTSSARGTTLAARHAEHVKVRPASDGSMSYALRHAGQTMVIIEGETHLGSRANSKG